MTAVAGRKRNPDKDVTPEQGLLNLMLMLDQRDDHDHKEGKTAYPRYRTMLKSLHNRYPMYAFESVVAAFCALSPNNDYIGNLNSLLTLMKHHSDSVAPERIKISTYDHCKDRAIKYLEGEDFDAPGRGLKTLNFYHNICDPSSDKWVTIDGHMVATYMGQDNMVMKDALVGRAKYREIADATNRVAEDMGVLPNQVQAMIWFTRKRILGIKYQPTADMFSNMEDDRWGIIVPFDRLKIYALR